MTARASAPAAISCGAFSSVMPPIATSGTPSGFASANSASGARTAAGLVGEEKTLPKAT